jgi:uncharacterized protein YecT (DUF1311 family)
VNGKRARPLRRSQENTRLTRKAATVERDTHEQEFDRQISEARDERAAAMKAANAAFEKKLKALEKDRKEAVQAADAAYIEKRDAIITRLSADQEKAA